MGTWACNDNESHLKIRGYSSIFKSRGHGRGVDVALFVHESVSFVSCQDIHLIMITLNHYSFNSLTHVLVNASIVLYIDPWIQSQRVYVRY